MLSFISFFVLAEMLELVHLRTIFQTELQARAVRPGLLLLGADSDLGCMGKTISVARLTSACGSLSCIHRHTQTQVQTRIHTHHLESTDSTYQMQPKR